MAQLVHTIYLQSFYFSTHREADLMSLAGSIVSDVDTVHLGGLDIGNLDDCEWYLYICTFHYLCFSYRSAFVCQFVHCDF